MTAQNSRAAFDLGIEGSSSTGQIQGERILATLNTKLVNNLNGGRAALTDNTLLTDLLDGQGLTTSGDATADLVITDRTGAAHNIDLDALTTIGELRTAVNTITGNPLTLSINKNALVLTDNTGGANDLVIANGATSQAADELGLAGTFGTVSATGANLRAQRSLGATRQVSFTNSMGVATVVDFSTDTTIQQVIDRINNEATGFSATLNTLRTGILLTDTANDTISPVIINDVGAAAGENVGFAAELGLAGNHTTFSIDGGNLQNRYIAESTRLSSLNGGRGVASGRFTITSSTGSSFTVDLSQGELTVGEVISEINSRSTSFFARVNDNGDGILVEDRGPGTVALKIAEDGSTTAKDLGILGEATNPGDSINGSFEHKITIENVALLDLDSTDGSASTLLSSLNGGAGVSIRSGQSDFAITTRDGSSYNINIDGDTTLEDVKATIEAATANNVTVNRSANGTALELVDNTSGNTTFTVGALNNSNAAADLGILGSATDNTLTGTDIVEVVTLESLATKINDAGIGVRASVINLNDGSPAPFRLSLTSTTEGEAGAFIFDDGGLNFGATTLTEGRNAIAFFGSGDPAKALAVSSTTNTLNTIPGATVTLNGTSDQPVTVTINRNDSSIVDSVQKFVDTFNTVIGKFDELDNFDPDTQKRSLLFGDFTISRLRSSLFAGINRRNTDLTGSFTTLSQLGIRVVSGGRIEFDSEKFQNALATDRTAVQQLFTFKQQQRDSVTGEITTTASGIGVDLADLLKRMTDSVDGTVQRRIDTIGNQLDSFNRRIDQQDTLIAAKRSRLEAQFANLEKVLANLQSQSSALASFQPVAPGSVNLPRQG